MFAKFKSFTSDVFSKLENTLTNNDPKEPTTTKRKEKKSIFGDDDDPSFEEDVKNKRVPSLRGSHIPPVSNNNTSTRLFSLPLTSREPRYDPTPRFVWDFRDIDRFYTPDMVKHGIDKKFLEMLKEFSRPRRYKQPDIQVIKEFYADCQDIKMIFDCMKMQSERNAQIKSEQESEFFKKHFKFYASSNKQSTYLMQHEFSKLPRSFKDGNAQPINEAINELVRHKRTVVQKMTKNSMRDSQKYIQSFINMQDMANQGSRYIVKVEEARKSVAFVKKSAVEANLKVTSAFTRKLARKKALYILEKIQKKYGSVVKYATGGLHLIPLRNYPDLYRVFVITVINLRLDRRSYASIRFLGKLEDAMENQLIKLRKKVRNQFYAILKRFRDRPSNTPSKDLLEILHVYEKFAEKAKELVKRRGCPDGVKKDIELIWDHLGYIQRADNSLTHPRISQIVKNNYRGVDQRSRMAYNVNY